MDNILVIRITLAWEDKFVEIALNSSSSTATVIPNASKSFGDISSDAIFFDAFLMAGGYLIMFAYTILMLGRLNRLEVGGATLTVHNTWTRCVCT